MRHFWFNKLYVALASNIEITIMNEHLSFLFHFSFIQSQKVHGIIIIIRVAHFKFILKCTKQ